MQELKIRVGLGPHLVHVRLICLALRGDHLGVLLPLHFDLVVLLFNELMALLEAARQERDVFELLLVEDFDDGAHHLLVEVSYGRRIVLIAAILLAQGAGSE